MPALVSLILSLYERSSYLLSLWSVKSSGRKMSKLSRLPNNAASEFNLKPFDATCEFAQESRPWIPQELRARAHEISGKTIFKKWYTKFETHHREILETRPAKLDPKRAQNFSKASIGDFYEKHEGTHFCFDLCVLLYFLPFTYELLI